MFFNIIKNLKNQDKNFKKNENKKKFYFFHLIIHIFFVAEFIDQTLPSDPALTA